MLINADCLDILPNLQPASVHLAILDLPYGQTRTHWDTPIDLDRLWTELRRILTPTGTVLAFGSGAFAIKQAAAALDLFKYDLAWVKAQPTQTVHVRNRPLPMHETISVFSKGAQHHGSRRMTYHADGHDIPQGQPGRVWRKGIYGGCSTIDDRPTRTGSTRSVIYCPKERAGNDRHPSAKPLALLRWLIERYSNTGDTILDPTMGSGSSIIAARACDRNFIGIERDPDIFERAKMWIDGVPPHIPDLPRQGHEKILLNSDLELRDAIAKPCVKNHVPASQTKGESRMLNDPIAAAIDSEIATLTIRLDRLRSARDLIVLSEDEMAAAVPSMAFSTVPSPTFSADEAVAHEAVDKPVRRKKGNATLSATAAKIIRMKIAKGERQEDVAREYGVSRATIYNVASHRGAYA